MVTWNNPPFRGSDTEVERALVTWVDEQLEAGHFNYISWQLERGSDRGTLHVQAYVQLATRQRVSAVRRIMPGSYAEVRRGTHDEAVEYTSKEDTRVEGTTHHEAGEPNREGAGRRTDLEDVRRQLFPPHYATAA